MYVYPTALSGSLAGASYILRARLPPTYLQNDLGAKNLPGIEYYYYYYYYYYYTTTTTATTTTTTTTINTTTAAAGWMGWPQEFRDQLFLCFVLTSFFFVS